MVRTRFSKVLALVLVFVMVMSSGTSAAAYTVISNKLTATVTVTANQAAEALAAVNALNITQVEDDPGFAMQAALENTALGLNLTEYNKLTAGGRRQAVADYVSFTKFAKGNFASVAEVQAAFDLGVEIETNKMNLLQLLNSNTTRTLEEIVADLKLDNDGLLDNFTETEINSFYGVNYGYNAIIAQNSIFDAYQALNSADEEKVSTLFMNNAYSGSYVTVLGYLKTAIETISAVPAITLKWVSGGTISGDNLAIGNALTGESKTISFEATANKEVSNIGYVVTSDKYISINGITAIKHFIDSELLTSGGTETKSITVKFGVAGDYNLTVEAVEQDDTTPTTFSNTSASVTSNLGSPRIELGFSLSEEIDLSQDKLGNILISYGKMDGSTFVETLKSDGTPIVKSKTWSGYLNLGDTGVKYCSGAENNTAYVNTVPADQEIKTVVDPNYSTMGYANDAEWLAAIQAGNVVVKVTVIDNEGNMSVTFITAN